MAGFSEMVSALRMIHWLIFLCRLDAVMSGLSNVHDYLAMAFLHTVKRT
jgi:hypothetical protein